VKLHSLAIALAALLAHSAGASIAETQAALQSNEFIAYSPGLGWTPPKSVEEKQLYDELALLHATGRQGVITFSMRHGLDKVPQIAKALGFRYVIVGLENPATDLSLITAGNALWIDGILVGNEGICRGLNKCGNGPPTWTASQLVQWIATARQNWPGKIVLTSEAWTMYYDDPKDLDDGFQPELLTPEGGDLVFPNLHPLWEPTPQVEFCPEVGVEFVKNVKNLIKDGIGSDKPEIVLHESWWPSDPTANTCNDVPGCTGTPKGYNEAAQSRYFSLLAGSGVSFVWGEAFDQPLKIERTNDGCGAALGPNWGLWRSDGTPKQVVASVMNRMIFIDGFESGNASHWSWITP